MDSDLLAFLCLKGFFDQRDSGRETLTNTQFVTYITWIYCRTTL